MPGAVRTRCTLQRSWRVDGGDGDSLLSADPRLFSADLCPELDARLRLELQLAASLSVLL